jgi:hypothetical protein
MMSGPEHLFYTRYPPHLLMLKRSGDGWRIGTLNAAIRGLTWFGPAIIGSVTATPCG